MAEVAITLKLKADEFTTLRHELDAHMQHLREDAAQLRANKRHHAADELRKREAGIKFLREKLG